jgi:hypothetical protein
MRAQTLLAGAAAINAVLPLAFADAGLPYPTELLRRGPSPSVSTSYSLATTLLVTNGNRVFTTMSVPIPFTIGGGGSNTSTGSGGGSTATDVRNSTTTVGGLNNTSTHTSTTTTTSTTLPYAASTLPYGGGGTSVAAPVPGGTGGLPQGPGDGYHNAAAHVKAYGTVVGLCVGIGTIAAVQLA